jgi:drug/metabolite transporter (DMT)-like permease
VEHNSRQIDWNTGGGLAVIVLWSTTIAVARSLSERLGPLTAGACVYSISETVVPATVTVLAYALWERAMRKGDLLLVAACSYFTLLLSTFVSCVYLPVTPGWRLWIGCLVLVTGSLMTWLSISDRSDQRSTY